MRRRDDYKMVIVAREDLMLSTGKLAVQVAHAAVECAFQARRKKPRWLRAWREQGSKKIVVRVKDLDELYQIKRRAEELGLITEMVKDAGLTEVPPGTETVLGIGPAPSSILDKVTGNLPLV